MYKKMEQNPSEMLDQGKQKENKDCCFPFFCWLFQIGIWIATIGKILLYFYQSHINKEYVIFLENYANFAFYFYIIYIILELCSPTSRYLCQKKSEGGIYSKMGELFRTKPIISFSGSSYHYVTGYKTRRRNGKSYRHSTRHRIITHSEEYEFPYYSERDVSGLFYLNCDKGFEKKSYVKLELFEEINFADPISYMDYEYEKDQFWQRNRFRDAYFRFRETRHIPGLESRNLVRLGYNEPCIINCFFFSLSIILTLCEFYKLYFNSLCIYQKFTIRKLISTRYDLTKKNYKTLDPQIDLILQQHYYEPQDYNYLNKDYKAKLPTQEELNRAKQYKNMVPDYKISSGGGEIQAGIILDDPRYSFYEPSKPPTTFSSVGGDIGLDSEQIKANGGTPADFGKPGFKFKIAS